MASKAIRRIVVMGGGSAGWLTAGVLAADRPAHAPRPVQVILVESPDVATIGVGEGTWPTMRDTLRRIGVSESDFLRECDASFKQGSRFDRWCTGADDDYYFHPFVLPQGYGEANLAERWREAHPHIPFADLASFQPHLCVQGKAPKQAATPEFAAVANYGYHLDAGKFAAFLQRHCVDKLGVQHLREHVTDVRGGDDGDIAALHTASGLVIEGDLFVDCTGMAARLLGGHYEVPFLSQRHVLCNDTALAVQLPYPDEDSPIASQTTSTAQRAGWIWDIGLPSRRGIGHVYSAAHCSDDEAEGALRRYIAAGGGNPDAVAPRKLRFEPGYRERFWHRNCVAIGLSAGFIEPLEASALALVELSAAALSDELPATRDEMALVARRFNEAFRYRWERVIDFLKLHYVLSQRSDSPYWIEQRESMPESLAGLLALWRHRAPSRQDFARIDEVFPSASYQYILYGMGFHTQPGGGLRRHDNAAAADQYFREAASLTGRMLAALPGNRELLAHVKRHGFPLL